MMYYEPVKAKDITYNRPISAGKTIQKSYKNYKIQQNHPVISSKGMEKTCSSAVIKKADIRTREDDLRRWETPNISSSWLPPI